MIIQNNLIFFSQSNGVLRSKLDYWKINWKKAHGIDWVRHCELLKCIQIESLLYFDINNQRSCSGSLWYNMYLSCLYHYFVLILSRNGLLLCLGSVTAYIVILPHIFFKCKLCCPVSNQIQLKVFKYNKKKINQSYIRFLTLWGVYIFECSMKSPMYWLFVMNFFAGYLYWEWLTSSCITEQPETSTSMTSSNYRLMSRDTTTGK